jgi:hypothetical protein
VAGRAGAMRAIAISIQPQAFSRQGSRRPTPRYCPAGEVTDFALVAVYGLSNGTRAAGGPRRVFCRRRRRHNYGSKMRWRWRACRQGIGRRLELAEGTSPRGITPPRCTSAEFFFSCYGSVAGYRPWRTAMATRPRHIFRDHTRPHPERFARRKQL